MKRWIAWSMSLALLGLMLCGCGEKVEAVPGETNGSAAVAEGSAETDQNGDAYKEAFFTDEAASTAEIIQAESEPEEQESAEADDTKTEAILEYASCLYPDYTAQSADLTSRTVNGTEYLFADVLSEEGSVICTIAYDAQSNIYYLYDSEVRQLIPIEYDQYGVRLIG